MTSVAVCGMLLLTGCGAAVDDGEVENHPLDTVQGVSVNKLVEGYHDDGTYEITGTNSEGVPFRCYVTDGYRSITQTCFEYETDG